MGVASSGSSASVVVVDVWLTAEVVVDEGDLALLGAFFLGAMWCLDRKESLLDGLFRVQSVARRISPGIIFSCIAIGFGFVCDYSAYPDQCFFSFVTARSSLVFV